MKFEILDIEDDFMMLEITVGSSFGEMASVDLFGLIGCRICRP